MAGGGGRGLIHAMIRARLHPEQSAVGRVDGPNACVPAPSGHGAGVDAPPMRMQVAMAAHNNSGSLVDTLLPGNNLLAALRGPDIALMRPHFRAVQASAGTVLYEPGQTVQTAYFPCFRTLVSFLVPIEEGSAVEALLVGREGAVGGIVSDGDLPAFARIEVQTGGDLLALPVPVLDDCKKQSPAIATLFARYADCLVAQMFQAAACNAAHSIEQRTAKWIIAASERSGSRDVPLTQERLASMLGVGRSYISRVIGTFKRDGTLVVRRGHLLVKDEARLRSRCCICHDAVKHHFHKVLKGVYPEA